MILSVPIRGYRTIDTENELGEGRVSPVKQGKPRFMLHGGAQAKATITDLLWRIKLNIIPYPEYMVAVSLSLEEIMYPVPL